MLSAKERAAGTAPNNNRRNKSYRSRRNRSSIKLAIGELLLFGNKQREEFWQLFESLLAVLYQSVPQSGLKRAYTGPESTKSSQGGIR